MNQEINVSCYYIYINKMIDKALERRHFKVFF